MKRLQIAKRGTLRLLDRDSAQSGKNPPEHQQRQNNAEKRKAKAKMRTWADAGNRRADGQRGNESGRTESPTNMSPLGRCK